MDQPLQHQRLLYVSRAAGHVVQEDVDRIVAVSTSNNAARDVTGVLLFSGEHFAQVLEGSAEALQELMAAIEADTRHADVRTLVRAASTQRRFARWSMLYVHDLGTCDLLEELLAAPRVSTDQAERLIGYLFERVN
jgi:predicted sulfurtransferase